MASHWILIGADEKTSWCRSTNEGLQQGKGHRAKDAIVWETGARVGLERNAKGIVVRNGGDESWFIHAESLDDGCELP